ncbi:MAG TPA: futalosine hydrolase [Candidatus Sphingobacterium stercoripullorum]|uniref:Futalosine hydrolase n=1 Tax=Candidatus Sphingobacterium stercoripullorum TaxID=2838759 RepID=A0A9D1W827_9SPHI|nr:futalosine hydrolase [Candidatus Sphingobacterium stercoripullorum]
MSLLIVAATELELKPSIEWLSKSRANYLVTGVGMVATATALARTLSENEYQLILNVGIAGCLNQDVPLASLAHIVQDQVYHFGAETPGGFISVDELGFGTSIFQGNSQGVSYKAVSQLEEFKGITVNKVHGTAISVANLKEQFAGEQIVESMEGAAVFYAAREFKVPALQVRSISNYIEVRNKENWKIPEAIESLNNWLLAFYKEWEAQN